MTPLAQWRWLLVGAAFLLGGIVRGDAVALVIASVVLMREAHVGETVGEVRAS